MGKQDHSSSRILRNEGGRSLVWSPSRMILGEMEWHRSLVGKVFLAILILLASCRCPAQNIVCRTPPDLTPNILVVADLFEFLVNKKKWLSEVGF